MPSPFPQARPGRLVNFQPSGFPIFFDKRKPRVVTADPWAFFRQLASKLPHERKQKSLSYISQAFDFYEAARNPHLGSKPLLYYYSFLNIVKASLLIKNINLPTDARHGIADPKINIRTRLNLSGQIIRISPVTSGHKTILPEFINALGGDASNERDIKVVELLKRIPSIHRTYVMVTKKSPQFIPITRITLFRSKGKNEVWARIVFNKKDKDVLLTIAKLKKKREFRSLFKKVASVVGSELWFESKAFYGRMRGVDKAIRDISSEFRKIGIFTILTHNGYRFYLPIFPVFHISQIAVAYCFMFYLGSITRYKPDVFDKIIAGGFAWIVEEFLATQPMQFLYMLASELAGVDVVRPFAIDH